MIDRDDAATKDGESEAGPTEDGAAAEVTLIPNPPALNRAVFNRL